MDLAKQNAKEEAAKAKAAKKKWLRGVDSDGDGVSRGRGALRFNA